MEQVAAEEVSDPLYGPFVTASGDCRVCATAIGPLTVSEIPAIGVTECDPGALRLLELRLSKLCAARGARSSGGSPCAGWSGVYGSTAVRGGL
jgi:hypothetical protein